MMGYFSAVVGVLALVAFAGASTGDNSLDSGERIVLVSPVLAPPQDSKIYSTVRARAEFPILVLLARRNPSGYAREPQKSEDQEPQDQSTPAVRKLNRQWRHLLKKRFGGGGHYVDSNPCQNGNCEGINETEIHARVTRNACQGGNCDEGQNANANATANSVATASGVGIVTAIATATATANASAGGHGKK